MIEDVHIGSEGWNNGHDEMSDEMKHEWYGEFEHSLNCFAERIDCGGLVQEMLSADGTAEYEAEREIEFGCCETAKAQRLTPESQHLP